MPYKKIALEDLMPPLVPVRRVADDEKMRELVLSIARDGLLQPLVVVPEDGQFRILAGHRRYIAVKHLGWEEVACNVLDADSDGQHRLTIMENLVREDVNPVDLGYYLRYLVEDEGLTQTEVAEEMDHSQAWVSRHIKLTTLDEDIQRAIEEGALDYGSALNLARIRDEEIRKQYTRDAVARGMSQPEVKRHVDAYKRDEEALEQAHHVAKEVRQKQKEEAQPLRCFGCGSKASETGGQYVWFCPDCFHLMVKSVEKETAEPPQGRG